MSTFPLKPTHKPVKAYFEALATFTRHGHTTDGNTRSAFADLLKKCCPTYGWHLVEEYQFKATNKKSLRADGALVDDLTLVHGLWKAQGRRRRPLTKEIKRKREAGYPLTNILFQSPGPRRPPPGRPHRLQRRHHHARKALLNSLDRFDAALEKAVESQKGTPKEQHFLKAVYEKRFQRFDTKQADTHGIVYTPQPIVDFMVRSVEEILQQEFGKSLSDSGVHILLASASRSREADPTQLRHAIARRRAEIYATSTPRNRS